MRNFSIICIASGPSLTLIDLWAVMSWRRASRFQKLRRVFVVNTTFRLAHWADMLVSISRPWWSEYKEEVATTFHGATFDEPLARNSGATAIALAARDAETITLLGYDGGHDRDGRLYWHEPHKHQPMQDDAVCGSWQDIFNEALPLWKESRVLNASRFTRFECFERVELHDAFQMMEEAP